MAKLIINENHGPSSNMGSHILDTKEILRKHKYFVDPMNRNRYRRDGHTVELSPEGWDHTHKNSVTSGNLDDELDEHLRKMHG